jgi:cysteine desulfurase
MWANNELGSLNPMHEISKLTREKKIHLHTDATQALGKIPVDLHKTPVDLLSLSSHKIYGPKGVGALYIRAQNPSVQIHPLLWGGGQEKGLRSGTVNVPGVVGLGAAMNLIQENIENEFTKAWTARKNLLQKWQQAKVPFRLNGPSEETVPQVLNLTFLDPNSKPWSQPWSLAQIAYSRGSACHSESLEVSHVLRSIGISNAEAEQTVRLSFGRMTTQDELEQLTRLIFNKYKIESP